MESDSDISIIVPERVTTEKYIIEKEVKRDANGRFLERGAQGGQPIARLRQQISGTFLTDYHKEWERSGPKALEKLAETDPKAFCMIAVALQPKDVNVNLSIADTLRDFLESIQRK